MLHKKGPKRALRSTVMKALITLTAAVAVGLGLASCGSSGPTVVTAQATQGPIAQVVTATGSVSPQDTILVGSQVSGTISALYVDYNSVVRTGQVLARLDPSTFQASLDQARATLGQMLAQNAAGGSAAAGMSYASQAAWKNAQSQRTQIAAADENVRKASSALDLAQATLRRDRSLFKQGFVAQNTVDTDVSNQAAAVAALSSAQADARTARLTSSADAYSAQSSSAQATGAISTAQADASAVAAARAAVEQAQLNLQHATITSPVDGTVIARNVSIGQTVAAALAAPTLFTIAKDLRRMELDISVGEPDVGSVHVGQPVSFTVLAYPGRTFTTRVNEVRQNPTVINNVTTYDTVAYPQNKDGALRPGMTATVNITVATYPKALIVPLSALQWRPSAAIRKRYQVEAAPAKTRSNAAPRGSIWGTTGSGAEFSVAVGAAGHVYVLDGNSLHVVPVTVLAIDGTRVGIRSNDTTLASAQVVTGETGQGGNASQ